MSDVPRRSPLTRQTGGPVDKPLKEIASRLGAEPAQVLLAWAKAKGVVVVTYALAVLILCPVPNVDCQGEHEEGPA